MQTYGWRRPPTTPLLNSNPHGSLPDQFEAKNGACPEYTTTADYTISGYTWRSPAFLTSSSRDYGSNYGDSEFVKQLTACDNLFTETFRAAATKNRTAPALLLQSGCSCLSLFANTTIKDGSGSPPSSGSPDGRLEIRTAAGHQTHGYYPRPSPMLLGDPKGFLMKLKDASYPLPRVASEASKKYIQSIQQDPTMTLKDLVHNFIPFNRATWFIKAVVLNTSKYIQRVDDKLVAEWTEVWQKYLARVAREMGICRENLREARYIVGLLTYQIQQGIVDPVAIVRCLMPILQPLDQSKVAPVPLKSPLSLMLTCCVLEPHCIAYCSTGTAAPVEMVEFCMRRVTRNFSTRPQGSNDNLYCRQYIVLCSILNLCFTYHPDLLPLAILLQPTITGTPGTSQSSSSTTAHSPTNAACCSPQHSSAHYPDAFQPTKQPPPKRRKIQTPAGLARAHPVPKGSQVDSEEGAQLVSGPLKRRWQSQDVPSSHHKVPKEPFNWLMKDILEGKTWANATWDGFGCQGPGHGKRLGNSWLASMRRARTLTKSFRLGHIPTIPTLNTLVDVVRTYTEDSRYSSLQFFTARHAQIPSSGMVLVLDSLLHHGIAAHVWDLLLGGDQPLHHLRTVFEVICEWAVRRTETNRLALVCAAELLMRFPKKNIMQGLCEHYLNAQNSSALLEVSTKSSTYTPIDSEWGTLTTRGRHLYALFGLLARVRTFSVEQYYKTVLVTMTEAQKPLFRIHVIHLPLDINTRWDDILPSSHVDHLLTQRRVLIDQHFPSQNEPCPDRGSAIQHFKAQLQCLRQRVCDVLGLQHERTNPTSNGPPRPPPTLQPTLSPEEHHSTLLHILKSCPPLLAYPLLAWLANHLRTHAEGLRSEQIRNGLDFMIIGDPILATDLWIDLTVQVIPAYHTIAAPTSSVTFTLLQWVAGHLDYFRAFEKTLHLMKSLVHLYHYHLNAGDAAATEARARLLQVVHLNRYTILEKGWIDTLIEELDGVRNQSSEAVIPKIEKLMEDLKQNPSSRAQIPQNFKPSSSGDWLPPNFCFPTDCLRPSNSFPAPAPPKSQPSQSLSSKATSLPAGAKPEKISVLEDEDQRILECIKNSEKGMAGNEGDGQTPGQWWQGIPICAQALKDVSLESKNPKQTIMKAVTYLVQRFLCGTLIYLHKNEGDWLQGRYLAIMKGMAPGASKSIMANMVEVHCLPYLEHLGNLLGPYHHRLLYMTIKKENPNAARACPVANSSLSAVACLIITAIICDALSIQAMLSMLVSMLEEFSKLKMDQQDPLLARLLQALMRLLVCLLDCNHDENTVSRGMDDTGQSNDTLHVWPPPRTHPRHSPAIDANYHVFQTLLHSALQSSTAAVLELSRVVSQVGRLWAACSTIPSSADAADTAYEVLRRIMSTPRIVQYLILQHNYSPMPLNSIFPSSCLRDPAWQTLLQTLLVAGYKAHGDTTPFDTNPSHVDPYPINSFAKHTPSLWTLNLNALALIHAWEISFRSDTVHPTQTATDKQLAGLVVDLVLKDTSLPLAMAEVVGLALVGSQGMQSSVIPRLLKHFQDHLQKAPFLRESVEESINAAHDQKWASWKWKVHALLSSLRIPSWQKGSSQCPSPIAIRILNDATAFIVHINTPIPSTGIALVAALPAVGQVAVADVLAMVLEWFHSFIAIDEGQRQIQDKEVFTSVVLNLLTLFASPTCQHATPPILKLTSVNDLHDLNPLAEPVCWQGHFNSQPLSVKLARLLQIVHRIAHEAHPMACSPRVSPANPNPRPHVPVSSHLEVTFTDIVTRWATANTSLGPYSATHLTPNLRQLLGFVCPISALYKAIRPRNTNLGPTDIIRCKTAKPLPKDGMRGFRDEVDPVKPSPLQLRPYSPVPNQDEPKVDDMAPTVSINPSSGTWNPNTDRQAQSLKAFLNFDPMTSKLDTQSLSPNGRCPSSDTPNPWALSWAEPPIDALVTKAANGPTLHETPPFRIMEDYCFDAMMPCDGCRVPHSVVPPSLWGAQPIPTSVTNQLLLSRVLDGM